MGAQQIVRQPALGIETPLRTVAPTRIRPQNRLVNVSQQTPAESYSLPGASAPDIAPKSVPVLEKVRREQVSGLFMLVMSENSGEPVPDTEPECRTVRSAYESRLLPLAAAPRDPRGTGAPLPTIARQRFERGHR